MTGQPYRLLTEAEWEYAARAGSTTAYYWGDEIGEGNANCFGCGSKWAQQTSPVGSFAANQFGLQDMAGNVLQWVQDCSGDYDETPTDGSAWTRQTCHWRVARGGSLSDRPGDLRSAFRTKFMPEDLGAFVGFRVGRRLVIP
jgi:formylglycine-generating enzyme required for sulfatase activity